MFVALFVLSSSSTFAQLEWVKFDGKIPDYAVIGGVEEGRTLPVCRCNFNGAVHPGKVVANNCNIGYGGEEKMVPSFEILVNNGTVDLGWEKSTGTLPENAIQAGTEGGVALYVGRAYHENGTHPGKVFKVGDNYICNIGHGTLEVVNTTFEVLVEHHASGEAMHTNHDDRCVYAKDSVQSTVGYIGSMSQMRQLNEGFSLVSKNIKYGARVTDDGRLVVEEILDHAFCNDGKILIFEANEIWSNTTEKRDPSLDYFMKFQEDGNLCIYSEQKGFVWCSMCHNQDGQHVELTNTGYLEVVNGQGVEIWPKPH